MARYLKLPAILNYPTMLFDILMSGHQWAMNGYPMIPMNVDGYYIDDMNSQSMDVDGHKWMLIRAWIKLDKTISQETMLEVRRSRCDSADPTWMPLLIDWFKGKNTGKSHISWENLWFPVDFPSTQPIAT